MRSPESRSPSRSRTAPEIQRLQAFRPISALSEEPSLQGCPSCSTVKACSFQVVPVVVVPEVLNDWHLEGRPVNLHESFLTRIDFELCLSVFGPLLRAFKIFMLSEKAWRRRGGGRHCQCPKFGGRRLGEQIFTEPATCPSPWRPGRGLGAQPTLLFRHAAFRFQGELPHCLRVPMAWPGKSLPGTSVQPRSGSCRSLRKQAQRMRVEQ